jgi:hypothetical protein
MFGDGEYLMDGNVDYLIRFEYNRILPLAICLQFRLKKIPDVLIINSHSLIH